MEARKGGTLRPRPRALPEDVVGFVTKHVAEGRQAYWVCPLIEESEALQLQTAQETYEQLSADLPNLRIGLVHGRLKADERTRLVPVVLVTALSAREDRIRGISAGCDDFLTKPVDLEQFMKVIQFIDEFWLSVVTLPRSP